MERLLVLRTQSGLQGFFSPQSHISIFVLHIIEVFLRGKPLTDRLNQQQDH